MKRCIDCRKEINPKVKRCWECHLLWKSAQMKKNNIAKSSNVKKKLSAKMQGEFGEKNRNWKGGITIIKGYIYVYSPFHPYCDNKRYYPLHRLIMEKKLKRILNPEETVHHKDENIMNNAPSNLRLFPTRRSHREFHVPKGKQIGVNL